VVSASGTPPLQHQTSLSVTTATLKAGFEDYGAVGENGGGLEQKGGTLSVKAVANGPLMLGGNFAIGAGSGRIAWQGNQAGFETEQVAGRTA
jgi:hypothetical protein